MGMSECPVCNHQISPKASTCPGCGHPFSGSKKNEVSVTDIDMPFSSMIYLMIKWAIAAIPAAIILFILGAIFVSLFSGFSPSARP